MYVDKNSKRKKSNFRFKINDQVRISYNKYVFQRDYHQKWTEEYFIITQRARKANHNMYKLKDLSGEDIDGLFYESELQNINKNSDSSFRVKKFLNDDDERAERSCTSSGWAGQISSILGLQLLMFKSTERQVDLAFVDIISNENMIIFYLFFLLLFSKRSKCVRGH